MGVRVLELGVLGPVRAVRDGRELGLGGPKPRAVLALLLADAGRVVPAEYLADVLWQGAPPPGAAKTLRSYVSRLRSLLDPEAALVPQGGGYAIRVQPDQVDASRFERLVATARVALEAGAAAAAAGLFAEALALWRGRALADVVEVEPLAREAARLEEVRLLAVEGRIEADLALGRAAEVTGELEGLVGEYPVRERLWRLLVLALYRAGRQADALAAYRRARDMLAAELGIEPGAELRALEQAVLRQEVPAAPPMARHNLPARLTSFLGREEELAAVEGLVGEARLVTLTGAGGAGKTRLALEFAAGAVERFGDGVWLADLAGIADAGLVPSVVMAALGVRQSGEVPVMEALVWRLRSAELLLVLDNCEHLLGGCAGLAVTLLGSCPGLRVLATSREPLGVPGEAVYPVPPLAVPAGSDGAQALAGAPAVRLFLARARSAGAGAGVAAAPVAVVARICRELDGLPLAIELAAARASVLSAEEIEAHLADKFRFLGYRQPVADPRHQTLKAAIGWSYDLLSEHERRVFGVLSVFAGGFTLAAAAAVCCGGDEAAALDLVDQLAAKSLVVAEPTARGTRYRLLETIRQYAAGRLAEAGEAAQVRVQHAEAYLQLAERERELPVLARELDNFRAALDFTLGCDSLAGPRLARALGGFWLSRGLFEEGQGWLERALATDPADPGLRAGLHRLLGAVLYAAGDLERAQAILAQGSEIAAAAGLPAVQARIQVLRAEIRATQDGNYTEAVEVCEEAAALLESDGELGGLAEALVSAGKLRFIAGDALASQALERAATWARRSGNHRAEQETRTWLVATFRDLPIPVEAAVGRAEQLLEAASGDPWGEAEILERLALLYGYAGRFADARAACRRAQSIFTGCGAKLDWGMCARDSGRVELIAGDHVAAERTLREGYEAFRAMGERGDRATIATLLAEAVYAQGRFDEALRLTEEAEAFAGAGDFEAQARWRATRAKLLARRGQFGAAAGLAEEAVALIPAAVDAPERAEFLVAQAEVSRLAGAVDQAEASLRRALQFYDHRRWVPLAERARVLLASLAAQSRTRAKR
jgi:predicted ATPase/DNA-binding SARP family transcriptional activator